jgi:hypothetical protein
LKLEAIGRELRVTRECEQVKSKPIGAGELFRAPDALTFGMRAIAVPGAATSAGGPREMAAEAASLNWFEWAR